MVDRLSKQCNAPLPMANLRREPLHSGSLQPISRSTACSGHLAVNIDKKARNRHVVDILSGNDSIKAEPVTLSLVSALLYSTTLLQVYIMLTVLSLRR